jgi:hypothetical protein
MFIDPGRSDLHRHSIILLSENKGVLLVGNYGTGKSHLIIGIFRKQEESQAFRPGIVVRLSEKGEAKKKAREPKGK